MVAPPLAAGAAVGSFAVLLLVILGLAGVFAALARRGIGATRVVGGMLLLAGTALGVAALVQADDAIGADGTVSAILAAGALVAGALLIANRGEAPPAP